MAVEALKVTATYDGANLDKGLNNLQKELAQTAVSANKFDSTLGKGVVKGANQGAAALTDFSRIIQDAPFGIIGISNNITQLGESFGRLKTSTGSTGGAIKALLGSLTGGGGLGLAISVITTAATFASVGFGAWTRGMQANIEKTKEAKSAYDEIIKSLAAEQVKVELIVAAIKNENLSRKQRIEAINQLQAISPAYFGTLNAEKATVEQIAAAYDRFSQSIIRNIAAKVKEKDLLAITEKILKLEEKGRSTGREQVVVNGKIVDVQNAQLVNQQDLNTGANQYQQFMKGTLGLTQQQQDELENLRLTQRRLIEQISGARGADPFIKLDKPLKVKEAEMEVQKITKVDFGKQTLLPFTPGAINTTLKIPIIAQPEIQPINQKEFERQLRAIQLNEGIQRILGELEMSIKQGIGNAITQGFSGVNAADIFGNFFKTILETLGTGIQQLGIQTLAAGKLIQSVKKLFGTSAGIGASIGLIVLGGVIKALAASIKAPAFATGGVVPGGGILVGERGPEILTPPRGSVITPNAQTNAMLAGGGGGGRVVFRIDGRVLVGVLEQTNDYLGRNGQR